MTQVNGTSHAVAPAPPRMTYEQFLEWPHENPHVEWVDGETVQVAPITDDHDDIVGYLRSLMTWFVLRRKIVGKVKGEPFQMKTGPDLPGRAPDVMFVGEEGLSRLHKTYLEGPADVCAEVISPESRTRDRVHKYKEYEEGGVREYWLIDAPRRQAEFYRLGEDRTYHKVPVESGVFRSEVMVGFWFRVDWLWDLAAEALDELGLG